MELPRIFSTDELSALGIGSSTIRRMVRGGELTRLRQGAYAWTVRENWGPGAADPAGPPPGKPPDPEDLPIDPWDESGRATLPGEPIAPGRYAPGVGELRHLAAISAAAREISAGTLFCQFSAGVLHGLPMPISPPEVVHLLREGSGSGRRTRTAVHHRARLPARDRSSVAELPCTGLARTVVDLARTLPFRDGLAVVDAALARGIERAELFSRLTRHPGNLRARQLVELGNHRSESPGESRCRATMVLAGIADPVCQFKIRLRDGRLVWSDYGWPDLGLVGEFDGMTKYGRLLKPGQSTIDALRRERIRERKIRDAGWWVIRWTTGDCRDLDDFRRGFVDATGAARHLRAA